MRVGSLRHRVTIQSYTESTDSFGGVTQSWFEYSKAFANIVPLSGTEKYVSKEKHATSTHQITIRYIAGIYPNMRITHQDRVFDIVSVINVGERNKMIQIIAEETPVAIAVETISCDEVLACDTSISCSTIFAEVA